MNFNNEFFNITIELANKAKKLGEVPVAAVIVDSRTNKIIARAINLVEKLNDPTAHAEILAIRKACKVKNSMRINDCDLYVNLEPCLMCAEAIGFARVRRLYFGAYDLRRKTTYNIKNFNSFSNHRPEIYSGICTKESKKLFSDFFTDLRNK